MNTEEWVAACRSDDVNREDVTEFEHAGRSFAIYRSPDDEYFVTDGLCTHEQVHLSGGLVMDDIIECPKHKRLAHSLLTARQTSLLCRNLHERRSCRSCSEPPTRFADTRKFTANWKP